MFLLNEKGSFCWKSFKNSIFKLSFGPCITFNEPVQDLMSMYSLHPMETPTSDIQKLNCHLSKIELEINFSEHVSGLTVNYIQNLVLASVYFVLTSMYFVNACFRHPTTWMSFVKNWIRNQFQPLRLLMSLFKSLQT